MADQVSVDLLINIGEATAAVDRLVQRISTLQSNKVNIPVSFASDSTRLQADLGQAAAAANRLSGYSESSAKNLREMVAATQARASVLQRTLDQQSREVDQLRQIRGSSVEVNRLIQTKVGLYKQTRDALKGATSEQQRLQEKLRATVSNTNQLKQAFNNIKGVTDQRPGGFFDSLIAKLTIGGIAVEAFKQVLQGIGDFIRRGTGFEQLNLSLQAFTGSAEEAAITYQSFKETAVRTPFSVADVAQGGKVLLAFGVSADEARDATDRLAVIAGATGSDLNNLARNLGQISAQGRAYTRDLNQFAIAGIPIYQQLGKQLGISQEQVRDFAAEGKIGFTEVKAALVTLTAAGGAFARLAAQQVNTVAGQWGNLQTEITEAAGAFIQAFGPSIISAIKGVSVLINLLEQNIQSVAAVILGLGIGAALYKIVPAVQAVTTAFGLMSAASQTAARTQAALATQTLLYKTAAGQNLAAVLKLTEGLRAAKDAAAAARAQFAASALLFVKLAAVAVAVGLAIVALNNAFTATQGIKSATEDFRRLAQASDEVRKKVGLLPAEVQKLDASYAPITRLTQIFTPLTNVIGAVTDRVGAFGTALLLSNPLTLQFGVALAGINAIDYAVNLAKAVVSTNEFNQGTVELTVGIQSAIAVAREYADSNNKTSEGIAETTGLLQGYIDVVTRELITRQQTIPLLQAQAEEQRKIFLIGGLLAGVTERQIEAEKRRIAELQKLFPELKKTAEETKVFGTATGALGEYMKEGGNTAANYALVIKAVDDELQAATKSSNELFNAQKQVAEAPLERLKLDLKDITREYDLQETLLKDQLNVYNAQLGAIDAKIKKQQLEKFGLANTKEELQLQLELNRTEQSRLLATSNRLGVATDAGRQARLDYIQSYKTGLALEAQLGFAGERFELENKALGVSSDLAQNEAERAQAAQGVRAAIASQTAAVDAILVRLERQKVELGRSVAEAQLLARTFGTDVNRAIDSNITRVQKLQDELRIASQIKPVQVPNGQPKAASGGPVSGGTKYTVNELGQEAFLSAAGRLSMINAPAWGTWRAPSSGTVIPAHLTAQLDIPRGGVNLNSPQASRVAKASTGIQGVRRSDHYLHQAMHRIGQAQQAQALELGRLSRAVDRMTDKDWAVEVNINGNNPLINKLRRNR